MQYQGNHQESQNINIKNDSNNSNNSNNTNIIIEDYNYNENETIIGIDFGSSVSGFAILDNGYLNNNFIFDYESTQLYASELVYDAFKSRGYQIGKKILNGVNRINYKLTEQLFLFRNFKRELNPKSNNNLIKSNFPEGKILYLDELIKSFLEELRDDEIMKNTIVKNKNPKDIKWVLTVPALWNEEGKKLMREAACKALLKYNSCQYVKDEIQIALEPEAATLAIIYDENIKQKIKINNTFLLIDAGGYTVDFSVNKIIDEKYNLEQLTIPKSLPLGSSHINDKIIEIIEYVYTKEVIDNKKKEKYENWEDMLDDIEETKINLNDLKAPNFKIKIRLKDVYSSIWKIKKEYYIEHEEYKGETITYSREYIYIPMSIIKKIYENLINNITKEIDNYMEKDIIIDKIIMTGGFSNCKILQEILNKKYNVDYVNKPYETVMKGAAIFGFRPNQILFRVIPITIGIENYQNKEMNNEPLIIVRKEDKIKSTDILNETIYLKPNQKTIDFYYSNSKNLNYGNYKIYKKKLGLLEISPDLSLENKKINIYMKLSIYISVSFDKENWEIFQYP